MSPKKFHPIKILGFSKLLMLQKNCKYLLLTTEKRVTREYSSILYFTELLFDLFKQYQRNENIH